MQKIKKIFALLCVCVMVVSTVETEVRAAEYTQQENTSALVDTLGFVIDRVTFNKTCTAQKTTVKIIDSTNGKKQDAYVQASRVYICREKGTYNDIILTWAQLSPMKYTLGNYTCYTYPESLTVSCNFINNNIGVEVIGHSPVTQVVSQTYTVGGSFGGNLGINGNGSITGGITGSISASVSKTEPVLKIKDYSVDNTYKVVYDFQPGKKVSDDFFQDYLLTTTHHIGTVSVKAKAKNYGFCMKFSSNTGHIQGNKIYNSASDCTRITAERSIVTMFE